MNKQLLKRLVNFRREIHQFPETAFQEYETRNRIKLILKEFGVKDNWMKQLNPTALVVDLKGEADSVGNDLCVAFRADMDALSMTETNQDLEYKSKNKGAAHMCGHDGHMTCLVGFVPLYLQNLSKIPKNKTVRLLFQPSEEGPGSGAEEMIKQNCLDEVNEVYGFHNWPSAPVGQLWCKEGSVMSECTTLWITIKGTGGHGSQPESLKVAIWKAMDFYQKILAFLNDLQKEKPNKFVCTLPVFQSGERFNVISDSAHISGTIRSFEEGLKDIIITKIAEELEAIKSQGFDYDFKHVRNIPLNSNSKKEAENIIRVAKEHFGQDKVGPGKLPFRASQDFAYFTQVKPGAFFFLSTLKNEKEPFLHNSNFDFNDDLIEKASTFWLKLALDRVHEK